jgi:hypothetical protein
MAKKNGTVATAIETQVPDGMIATPGSTLPYIAPEKGSKNGKGPKRPPIRQLKPKADKSAVQIAVEAEAAEANGMTLEEMNGEIEADSALDPETEPEKGSGSPSELTSEPKGKKGPKGAKGSPPKGRKGRAKKENPSTETKRRGRPKGSEKGTALDKQPEPLTPVEFDRFQHLRTIVKEGLDRFIEVGAALSEIRSGRLYRDQYKTFAEFCEKECGVSERIAAYSIGGSQVLKKLEAAGVENMPENKSQTRHLIGVPEDKLVETWKDATELARAEGNETPSVLQIKAAADKVLGKDKPKSTEPRDVQTGRKNGAIPQGASVEIREEGQDPNDTEEAPVDIDSPDEDWLSSFPLMTQLGEDCLPVFKRDALDYRWVASSRVKFIGDIKRLVGSLKGAGPYIGALMYRLRRPDPSQWVLCPTCKGQGKASVLGQEAPCTDCRRDGVSAGYKV